ncbi:MAG: hypothetical protein AB1391_01800 [Candidatus Micrarchaeota archaeon]
MRISGLLKKENIYKVLVVGFVLVFILSSFSTDLFKRNDTGGNAGRQNTSNYFETKIAVNATIVEYQPYIATNLRNAVIAETLKTLPNVDKIIPSSQGYVISLKNTSNITSIYSYLASQNISGKVNAVLSLPSVIEVLIDNSRENISGTQIYTKLEPIFEEGENVTVSIFLAIQNNQIIGNELVATILPSLTEFNTNANIIALTATKVIISVPWEKDSEISENIANITAKYGADKVLYLKNDSEDEDSKNASFANSLLIISLDASDSKNMSEFENFSKNYEYTYNIRIDNTTGQWFLAYTSPEYYKENDSVMVRVSAYTIKDKISDIISARTLYIE